jgi:hypothetical protein
MTLPFASRVLRSGAGTLLMVIALSACASEDPAALAEREANEPSGAPDGVAVDEITRSSAAQLACTVSIAAGVATLAGAAVCWVAAPAAGPVCAVLTSTGLTAARIANSVGQCVTGCGVTGAACASIGQLFSGTRLADVRAAHVGCNVRGDWVAESDVCARGLNAIYPRGTSQARGCVAGRPTGYWALSSAERAYLRNPANCVARGFSAW